MAAIPRPRRSSGRRPQELVGVREPVDRVVVVGAGVAGLTLANALTQSGVECVVLEARGRVGGRLHSIDLGGSPVDLGAAWIRHPVGNPLRVLADEAGIAVRPGNPLPGLASHDLGAERRLRPEEVAATLALVLDEFPAAMEELRTELGPDASAADGIALFVSRRAMAGDPGRRTRQALRAVIESDAADLADRQSLRWLWHQTRHGGDYFGDLPEDGFRSLVDVLAKGIDVRLGVGVDHVEVLADRVRVLCSDGSSEVGTHVVVTVPLGVLKRRTITFSPPLPPERVAAIEGLGFGHHEKVALRFEERFWRTAGLAHLLLFPSDPHEAALLVANQDVFDTSPVLVCQVSHSATRHVLGHSRDEAARWALGMLAHALGRECPAPTEVAATSWGTDELCGGAWTHVPPGADPAWADLLGEPIDGRLLFAGEHTQSERLGYADGAMSSGIREASRLLDRRDVRVGPLLVTHSDP